MKTNKKAYFFFFIVFLAVSAVLAYASKNLLLKNARVAATKIAPSEITPTSNLDMAMDAPEKAVAKIETTNPGTDSAKTSPYLLHKNISTTYFWVGEKAGKDNKNISNLPSAWDENWQIHYGGVDDPVNRNGFYPASFTPQENPFYFALPYNDFDEDGNPKNDPQALAIFGQGQKFGSEQSICKNQWIKIVKGDKVAYAQWEDVGPFGEDDKAYVFDGNEPKSKENDHAGLDVSPAVHDYLSLGDIDKTDWQFIDAKDVPDGPWKKIITTSQVYWK